MEKRHELLEISSYFPNDGHMQYKAHRYNACSTLTSFAMSLLVSSIHKQVT